MLKEESHVKEASEAAEAKHVEAGSSAQKSASFVYCRQSTAAKSCQFGLWQWKVCALYTTKSGKIVEFLGIQYEFFMTFTIHNLTQKFH